MKISGVANLKRKIAAMPKVAKEEIRKALTQGAEEINAIQKSMAPKGDGDLTASIGNTFGPYTPDNSNVRGMQATGGGHDLAVTLHAGDEKAFYAGWVENGTAPHSLAAGASTKAKKRRGNGPMHPGSKAQPFFFPGYRLGKKRALGRIARAYGKAAKKVAGR